MSAADLGTRMFAEVSEEGLDELLSSLRVVHDPTSQYRLGIPPLDRLLALFTSPFQERLRQQADHEQTYGGRQSAHRAQPKSTSPPFIELTSSNAGDGKTQLLYYIIAVSVLPPKFSDLKLGGQGGIIIVLDTDDRFSVARLATVMKSYISTQLRHPSRPNHPHDSSSPTTAPNTDQDPSVARLIADALSAVHIFRPQSLASLTATVAHLPAHLSSLPPATQRLKRVSGIVLDSASAFLWAARADAEDAAAAAATAEEAGYPALLSALRRASRTLQAPVLYTTWTLGGGQQQQQQRGRQGAARLWPHVPVLRLGVARRDVRRFPVGMSAGKALADRAARTAALRRGWFEVGVRGLGGGGGGGGGGGEGWSERVVLGMRSGEGRGFCLRVVEGGVFVGDEDAEEGGRSEGGGGGEGTSAATGVGE
ncbi:hypothetical protein MBLNU459_g2164t1 [Dothideomycetes sp. NU459]